MRREVREIKRRIKTSSRKVSRGNRTACMVIHTRRRGPRVLARNLSSLHRLLIYWRGVSANYLRLMSYLHGGKQETKGNEDETRWRVRETVFVVTALNEKWMTTDKNRQIVGISIIAATTVRLLRTFWLTWTPTIVELVMFRLHRKVNFYFTKEICQYWKHLSFYFEEFSESCLWILRS